MSLATSEPTETKFLVRFAHVWASLRRFQIRQGLCWTFLAAALGLVILTAADFRLELPWNARAGGLFACAVVTAAVLWARVVAPLRWWTKSRTAAEIESRFPQLGQRIRTVIQYAGLSEESLHTEGAAPSLVGALEQETDNRVRPLPLDRVVPWTRAWAVAALAVIPVLFLVFATARNAEWRIALSRALLSRRPYTTLAVAPENILVDQGDSVPVTVELHGRLKRNVVLYTRAAGQPSAAWKAVPLDLPDRGAPSKRQIKLEKIEKPLDYRAAAGSSSSPTYRIEVRYPLALSAFDVALKPAAYTGVKPSTVKGGDLRVVEGTEATFQIAFDAPTVEASLVLSDPSVHSSKEKAPKAPVVIPLKSSGTTLTAELKLTKGVDYQILASTADGRIFPKHQYKIEVLEDRAPRVGFEQPDEAIEVHPVAEVLHRIRVGDDFGLTRAGIIFQFNNGDEQMLIAKDFKNEPAQSRTSAALQEMLLLEKLAASPTDSLTYYAFAEDNYPAGARRTETDLRYIDIRPFKREYKLAESGSGLEREGEFTSLSELIARQRYNLNRAMRLAKHKPADKTFADDPLKIAGFEETLVELTRELTEGFEGIVGQRIEPLHAAEESMLAAVAALDRGQNARAPTEMGAALRHLIQARNTLRVLIGQDDAAARQAMRSYDRAQTQKIRKPKKDQEEAEEIAEQIEMLAQDEEFVYATLAAVKLEQQAGESKTNGETTADEPKGVEKNKRREAGERQEQIVEKLHELEEKLKKLEAASDLAKARMANAAETALQASGALARRNTNDASEAAKATAAKLHELARQLKGELAREVAQELAMARDLADELANREAEIGQMPGEPGAPGADPGGKQTGNAQGQGNGGTRGRLGWSDLTEAERLQRLEEAARTLEHWLKDASLGAEGESADRIRQLIEESESTRVVDRMQRIGALFKSGQTPEARRDAKELSGSLEKLSRQLDALYRGIIAPELAKLAELEKRVAELMERLKTSKTDAEIAQWDRLAEDLVRDLAKAGMADFAKELEVLLTSGNNNHSSGLGPYERSLASIGKFLERKIQDLILKDMMSARDEAIPPAFKELVERYYEVLSRNGGQ